MTHRRPPFAALAHERLAGIGHNKGPSLEPGRAWRTHCWREAKRTMVPRAPIEVVRRRVARARALGLEYPAYASILLGTGRDVRAFLFTAEAVRLAVRRALAAEGGGETWSMEEARAAKLRAIEACERFLVAEAPIPAEHLAEVLAQRHRLRLAGIGAPPAEPAPPPAARAAIRALLDPHRLPGDAVVLVGTQPEERDWADAAQLAKFLAADLYFAAR